jgi:hypothetical protein
LLKDSGPCLTSVFAVSLLCFVVVSHHHSLCSQNRTLLSTGLEREAFTALTCKHPAYTMVDSKTMNYEVASQSSANEKHRQDLENNSSLTPSIDLNDNLPVLTEEHRDYLIQRHGTVDLDPLPSADPADPYNWPQWKKVVNLSCVAFHVSTSRRNMHSTVD